MIFFLIGEGGSGKDTLLNKVLEYYENEAKDGGKGNEPKIKRLITYTTRPMREEEQSGVEYYFVDKKTFWKMRFMRRVIEYREYKVATGDTWYYFTANDGQIKPMTDLIAVGPLAQYYNLNNRLKTPVIPIYLKVSEENRRKRLYERESKQANPNYEEVERRLKADREDFKDIEKIPGLVVIDNNGNNIKSTLYHLTNTINNILDSYYMLKADVLGIKKVDSQTVTEFKVDDNNKDITNDSNWK